MKMKVVEIEKRTTQVTFYTDSGQVGGYVIVKKPKCSALRFLQYSKGKKHKEYLQAIADCKELEAEQAQV